MRTLQQEQASYQGITPATFGRRVGGEKPLSVATVHRLIEQRLIRPELVTNVSAGTQPRYRIHPDAVRHFLADRSLAAEGAAR